MKVDSHHHLWDLERYSYPWLQQSPPLELVCGNIGPIMRTYSIEWFLDVTAAAGVDKSIHIEAGNASPVEETRWLQDLSERFGFPSAIVVGARLDNEELRSQLDAHVESSVVRGVRQIVAWHPDPRKSQTDRANLLTDPSWQEGFALLSEYGLSFDLQIYPHQVDDALSLLARFPETTIALEHALMPADRDNESMSLWRTGLRKLASVDCVDIKISGLAMFDHNWTIETWEPIFNDVLNAFGPQRTMLGSNFPVDDLHGGYLHTWDAFRELTRQLSSDEIAFVEGQTAARFYRL